MFTSLQRFEVIMMLNTINTMVFLIRNLLQHRPSFLQMENCIVS